MFRGKLRVVIVCVPVLLINFACPLRAETATSSAEGLLGVVPDEVVGFVATSGGDDLKPAFEKSILGRMWYEPEVQNFYKSIKKELLAKVKQEMGDPNDAKIFDAVTEFAKMALKRPIIIGAARKGAKDEFPVYFFAILDAGSHKAEIASAVAKLEALAGEGKITEIDVSGVKMHAEKGDDDQAYWGWVGNYLVFTVNDTEGLAMRYLLGPRGVLAGYLKKVSGTGDALAMYIDFQKIANVVNAIAEEDDSAEELKPVSAAMNELGLSKVKSLTGRAGFVGPDVVVSELLEVPQPRTGLFANFRTINLSALDMVNAGAMNAVALDCDIAGIYDTIMRVIKVAAPNDVYAEVQKGIADFESQAGLSIRKGLLESLTGPIVFYSIPPVVVMEVPSGGFVVIAKLKDAALLEKTMVALGNFAAAKSNGMLQVSSQVQDDGRTLHLWMVAPLAMMQILPCWTIVDGQLVVASNMTMSNVAVKQINTAKTGAKSIRTTEGYKKVAVKLPDNLICLRYTDSKLQFNNVFTGIQRFWPMVTMVAAKQGVNLPFMLPSVADVVKDMGPSCEYCRFDAEGLRSYYQGPGVEQTLGGAAVGAPMVAAVMMPVLSRVRQTAQTMVSATNLSVIGKTCLIYASDHNEQYPANLEELVEKAELPSKSLESPLKPKDFDGPSYIYVAGQNASMSPENIIAYENPGFCCDKINVLFNDCHVQAMKRDDFLRELEATYKRLGREMPKIEFKSSGETEIPKQPRSLEQSGSSDTDAEGEVKRSALRKAVEEGDLENVRSLIAEGADVNVKYDKSETPLYIAIESGQIEIARLLIEKGANVNAKGGRFFTPLHLAARFGHVEMVELLISEGADVNAKGIGVWTPLLLAVRFGNTEMAKLLIAKGADIYAETDQAMTPLLLAVIHNYPDIEKLLLSKGAQLDIFSETIRGDAERVEAFLERDPNLVSAKRGEFTLLHWAAYCGHLGVAELLIAKGAEVDANSKYVTPLHWAVRYNHRDMIELLIGKGADVNAKGSHGRTLLHYAVAEDAVKLLLDNRADVNAKDDQGASPLHLVVSEYGHRLALTLVIPFNADISAKHSRELHVKAEENQIAVAELLIANGANVIARDKKGLTPFDVADKSGYRVLAELLRKYEVKENAR